MTLKKTPLYDTHLSLGAKLVGFADYEMPVKYTNLIEEHNAVRNACGIFDVSHMGEIMVTGADALKAVNLITTNDAGKLIDGKCQYTLLCNDAGGVIDDVIVYRINSEEFLICVNGSNREKAYRWITDKVSEIATVRDASDEYALIAVQGATSAEALKAVVGAEVITSIKPFSFISVDISGKKAIVSRTGYTGEAGFEIYLPTDLATDVWNKLMATADETGILPCGLGARDTLRLEMGYPLYGNELDEGSSPLSAGLGRFVVLDSNDDFIGKCALLKEAEEGSLKILVGLEMEGRAIARGGYEITKDGITVGHITSGTFSPTLNCPIAVGYVDAASSKLDTEVEIIIRGKAHLARVVRPCFYKRK